ncbi:hypothetical protein I545_2644 [Mycobacterium kansasii 662]|uniref:Uncharacterized protein n=3 Tax=Mycobacterium kansasii TaxID=1768 RepID=A0A1V3WNM4_MYCKA|nr:hypothetical protein MKAN_04030 [Mycobacterium kansasii ATCC 12478]EUA00849.1 hypothetical protein I547_4581 [Mycobacterium kansasii 824]EUA18839.1 hypothetical protein I545_2644 [Mycobacterium kansasii 662]KEP40582.1 hypothetical protein MKSMC1_42990 [Mycobacterium kansasii]OOK68036.1 hypothetical protein BZL29_6979 [Mycobacterium kansasii]
MRHRGRRGQRWPTWYYCCCGGLFDIHQQFGELLPGKFAERRIDPPTIDEAA